MPRRATKGWLELGLRSARSGMQQQDKIWSRYSNDKIDIAGALARVIRALSRELPLTRPLTALSIGSSDEPQFRILESAFRGGLYLLDIDAGALRNVEERSARQRTAHVKTICGNYCELFANGATTRAFRARALKRRRVRLITLHHSLYYSPRAAWPALFANLYRHILASSGAAAIHAVLMSSHSDDRSTTTWLYNHFAGRFFGASNDQDLRGFKDELRSDRHVTGAQVLHRASRVEFDVDDFERFMSVVWMILLHPSVHRFTEEQQREVTEYVYRQMWSRCVPLVQMQDHMAIYRGVARGQV